MVGCLSPLRPLLCNLSSVLGNRKSHWTPHCTVPKHQSSKALCLVSQMASPRLPSASWPTQYFGSVSFVVDVDVWFLPFLTPVDMPVHFLRKLVDDVEWSHSRVDRFG